MAVDRDQRKQSRYAYLEEIQAVALPKENLLMMIDPPKLAKFTLLLLAVTVFSAAAGADPATRSSERIERFGYWYVVKKPATYVVAETGQRGRYNLCSAVLFAQGASLEFEAKNDRAWSFYIAKDGWEYSFSRAPLTLKSGSESIRIPAALYGGSMISGMSHDLSAGSPITMDKLRALISEGEPISISDSRGRTIITFPNSGSDLPAAFGSAISCSMANSPG